MIYDFKFKSETSNQWRCFFKPPENVLLICLETKREMAVETHCKGAPTYNIPTHKNLKRTSSGRSKLHNLRRSREKSVSPKVQDEINKVDVHWNRVRSRNHWAHSYWP